MKTTQLLLAALVGAVVALGVTHYAGPQNGAAAPSPKETALERILRTGTLRCGYFEWPPFVVKDPNSGKMSGFVPDVIEEIAHQMGIKVEWVTEVDMAHMFEGYGRYDMVCAPVSRTVARARATDFSMPLGYGGLYVYVRADDHRFDENLSALNATDVKFSVIDGEYTREIVREDFPKATPVAVTQMGTGVQMLMDVSSGKTDAAILEAFSVESFQATNQGKIRPASVHPVRVMSFSLPIPQAETTLRRAIDAGLVNLYETGFMDKVYRRYESGMAHILRPAKPYQE